MDITFQNYFPIFNININQGYNLQLWPFINYN